MNTHNPAVIPRNHRVEEALEAGVRCRGAIAVDGFGAPSREAMLLTNNLLLVVATAAVLLGTLYPLLYEVITDGDKISVGPPYFNRVFVPIVLLLFVVMIASPFVSS